jgi:hypothetical protein
MLPFLVAASVSPSTCPFDKPLDMLGALSLSKRLRVPSGVEGLGALSLPAVSQTLSLPAVSQTLSEVEWELVEPVERELVEPVETASGFRQLRNLASDFPRPREICVRGNSDQTYSW